MCHDGDRLPDALLDRPVAGSNLYESPVDAEPTLRDQLDPTRPTLLVFLRHLGCAFAREAATDVRRAAETADGPSGPKRFPRVVFVHTANRRQGGRFAGRTWPAATAVSDPGRDLYDAAGLRRGGAMTLFGPRVWPNLLRVAAKGYWPGGRPVGDVRTLPGVLLVSPDGCVLHKQIASHVGQRFEFNEMPHSPAR